VDRAHRIGQTREVTVYRLIMKGTVEESILQMQQRKQQLGDSVLGGSETQPNAEYAAAAPSKLDSNTMSALLEHALGLSEASSAKA
jgi:SNF2 family DNA or RNA helicase